MADVKFDQTYSPAEATRGSWAPIDGSTISLSPSSRGRYAQLNYIVGAEEGALSLSLSGSTVVLPVSTINIDEPLRIENEPGDTIAVTKEVPNSVYNESLTLSANHTKVINFASSIMTIEIYNNSNNSIYYLPYSTTTATVSTDGLPITSKTYYSIDRTIDDITLLNDNAANTNVRILGHYKV